MWRPSRSFKENFVLIGFFLASVFVIGLFAWQCALWMLVPVIALVVVFEVLARRK